MGLLTRLFRRQRRSSMQDVPRELLEAVAEFNVGDRVEDAWGAQGTVQEIDLHAEHGMGRITVLLDDGRESAHAAIASGLRKI